MFDHTHIDLRLWMVALLLFCQSPRLLPSSFLGNFLGISALAALGMRNKIWRRLGEIATVGKLGGPDVAVEIDETLIARLVRRRTSAARLSVFGITDRQSYRVFLVQNRARATLLPIIAEHIAIGSVINTDGFAAYDNLGSMGYHHKVCVHKRGFFVGFDGATTTAIDGYWCGLKTALSGIHHGISEARLPMFLDAHACRYSYRNKPAELFWRLVGGIPNADFVERSSSLTAAVFSTSHSPECTKGSYPQAHAILSKELAAKQMLSRMALAKYPTCAVCGAVGCKYAVVSDDRIVCSACGSRQSLRADSIFSGSKIPVRIWIALIWLLNLTPSGVSIAFAMSHLNVSNAAAITMLTRTRRAMADSLRGRTLGGPGERVDLGVYKLRVRSPPGHPRARSRTLIVAMHEQAWICDILNERSARYLQLWVKKTIKMGSIVRHPAERLFGEVERAAVKSEPLSLEESKALSCRGPVIRLKTALRVFHHLVDHEKAILFIKEIEFKACWKDADWETILEKLAFQIGGPPRTTGSSAKIGISIANEAVASASI